MSWGCGYFLAIDYGAGAGSKRASTLQIVRWMVNRAEDEASLLRKMFGVDEDLLLTIGVLCGLRENSIYKHLDA